MKTKLLLAGTLGLISLVMNAQTVSIPDANFKAYLTDDNDGFDTNDDGEIQVSEAEAVTGKVNTNAYDIADFTGLEAFINITKFEGGYNTATSLDLTANTKLEKVYLHHLELFGGQVLKTVNLSGLTALDSLQLYNTPLTSLNLTGTVGLLAIDLHNTKLKSLDLSAHSALTQVDVGQMSELESLNLKNGANTNITDYNSEQTPNLNCIQVDDADYSNTNWTDKDDANTFSTICITGNNPSQIDNSIVFYPNPANTQFTIKSNTSLEVVKVYSLSGKILISTSKKSVDINGLASGMYIVEATTEKGISTQRLSVK